MKKIVCDRCGAEVFEIAPATTRGPSPSRGWVVLRIANCFDAHVCPTCVPSLAELLPRVDRAFFEPFTEHEISFDVASEVHMRPDQAAQITAPPRPCAFRATRIEITRPADWVVHDVRIGNRSQLSPAQADVPAEVFAGADFVFETCQPAMDFVLVVTYVGKNPEGATFHAKITALEDGLGSTP